MMRYALVALRLDHTPTEDATVVAAYLPKNYSVCYAGPEGVVVCGIDQHGWTLDGYVIPRLGSGLYSAQEIDLSHPVMKQIPM